MNTKKRRIFAALVLLVIMAVSSASVFAAGKIDPNKNITLNISYKDEEKVIPKAAFSIYKIADADEYARMALTSEFEAYGDSVSGLAAMEDLTQDEWTALALTLAGNIKKDKISSAAEGKTDSDGNLSFSGFKAGLYLVIGKNVRVGDYVYSSDPFFVFLPSEDQKENEWYYEVTAAPKKNKDFNPEDEYITRKVLKVWDDEGFEDERPSEVTVRLLRDGKEYDVQILSESNGWSFKWEKLNSDHDWDIVEDEVDGYTTSITRSGITYTVTNTHVPEIPVFPDVPGDPDVPGVPGDPDIPVVPGEPEIPGGTLPQTGVLWWPALLLAAAGLIAVIIGLVENKKQSN